MASSARPALVPPCSLRNTLRYDKRDRDRLSFRARVGRGVLGKLQRHAVGVVAHLGDRLGEPAVDGAVHQAVAEDRHEDDGDERDQHGPPQHARAQARAHDAAALVGVELEHVAHQQHQHSNEEQKRQRGEAGKDDNLAGSGGIEELEREGVQRGKGTEQHDQDGAECEADDLPAAYASAHRHRPSSR